MPPHYEFQGLKTGTIRTARPRDSEAPPIGSIRELGGESCDRMVSDYHLRRHEYARMVSRPSGHAARRRDTLHSIEALQTLYEQLSATTPTDTRGRAIRDAAERRPL